MFLKRGEVAQPKSEGCYLGQAGQFMLHQAWPR